MGTLSSEQDRAAILAELGAKLKQIRQEKALSLEYISAKTMIQPRLLSAIEEGKLDELPAPIYTQGFIRRFADILGLNGTEFAKAFPSTPIVPAQSVGIKSQRPPAQLRPFHLYILYIGVIAAAVSVLSYMLNRTARIAPSAIKTVAPTVAASPTLVPTAPGAGPSPSGSLRPAANPTASPNPQSPVAGSPSPGASPKPPAQPVSVGVSLKEASWLRVVADGNTVYEGTLPAGAKQSWNAKNEIILRSGNAGGVSVSFNNAPPKVMGELGDVSEETFTPVKPSPAQPPAAPAQAL
jgi:cytoskeletal protein RodZ